MNRTAISCDWECDRGVNQKQTDGLFVVVIVSIVQAIKAHPSSVKGQLICI